VIFPSRNLLIKGPLISALDFTARLLLSRHPKCALTDDPFWTLPREAALPTKIDALPRTGWFLSAPLRSFFARIPRLISPSGEFRVRLLWSNFQSVFFLWLHEISLRSSPPFLYGMSPSLSDH